MSGVAFFDMDHTIISANSGRVYARALRSEGQLGLRDAVRVGAWLLRYKLGRADMSAMLATIIEDLKGLPEIDVIRRCEALFDSEIAPTVYHDALDRIRAHRERGEPIVILSASTPYIVRQLAQFVGADDYLCTSPHVRDGVFTGDFDAPICFGAGKLVWAKRYCGRVGRQLEHSAFYTDSYSDVPVLEAVGRPVVVNPDPRLARAARLRGWPVEQYRTILGPHASRVG